MTDRRFDTATRTEYSQELAEVTVPSADVDSAGTVGETVYESSMWKIYNGFYRTYPEIKSAVDKVSSWSIGKGHKNASKEEVLKKIKGFGKDSFDSIMGNMIRVKKINGDAFAEIIKDESGGLINLKPLNPGSIRIVANPEGMVVRYEQINLTTKEAVNTWTPEEIFHLINDREADEIHGISIFESLSRNLLNVRQLDDDMGVVFHRYVMPMLKWEVDTNDSTEIAKIKAQAKQVREKGQDIIVPKDAVVVDTLSVPQYSSLDPLTWRQEWIQEGVKSTGVPEIIMGKSADIGTEASSKVVYLSFQQVIENEQRELEEQIRLQLGIELEYEFPARIEEDLEQDEKKDGSMAKTKPSDIQP